MDDYLCITLLSRPNESEAEFNSRLSDLWTHMLRHHETDFEKVYAEMVAFEKHETRLGRKYLVELEVKKILETQLETQGIEYEPIDVADLYSKYEATPPEWFWIEH